MQAPELPGKTPLATEIEETIAKMDKPAPRGMTSKKAPPKPKRPEPKEEPEAEEESEPEVKKPAEPEKKEPVTQEKLSSGFAKLARQQKAVEREEARIKAELAKLEAAKQEHETTTKSRMTDLEKRQADIDALVKLFEEDEEQFLEAVAKKRGTTKDAFYDRLTRRRLNGGVQAPEDQIARSNGETEKLRQKLEAIEAEKKAEKEAAEKEKKDAEDRARMEAAVHAENAGFLKHVKEEGKYPLLSKEADADIIAVARKAAGNTPVGYAEIADYLERLLTFQKWQEEQAGKPAEAETPKTESAPKPEGQKAEPKKASTITNKMATPRTPKSESTPRNDDERLARAVGTWK
jgi:predicted  nucleic acid-binding Zn-ribbon protein